MRWSRLSRRGDENGQAPNFIGAIGGSDTEAGRYWMVESEGCYYLLPVWESDLILVWSQRAGNA